MKFSLVVTALEAKLPTPRCGKCGDPMERHSRCGKTFQSRFGPLRIERTYCRCRKCGGCCFPLDIVLGLEGKTITPGAESLCADLASSDSYEAASRKLRNLAGVCIPKTTLRQHGMRIGQEMQAFEHEDAEAETPAADRIVVGIDGTGVPMRACEVEGVAGRTSDFAARLDRFGIRNGLFEAKELAVLSDGAAWIRKVCEEVFAGRDVTLVLDLFHALGYVATANRDMPPGESGRTARMDRFKERLAAGQIAQVIAELKPHRHSSEAVAACIDYFEANKDRMRCDLYRKRGLPVGSGIVESACKQIVGSRFKRARHRWSKAGANALLAVKCCIENNRWADFLDWRNQRVAAA